ncbi:MAG: hypothetical protein HC828_15095, partial [Blastochloris sp.]|nr:hypothetical protein [Blastochloris sp.]
MSPFVGSGIVLAQAYRRTIITHVRRQIRLIASACLFVGMVWLVLLALPLAGGSLPLIADAWLDLLTALIPLAYLIGGVLPNLYHLDRRDASSGAGSGNHQYHGDCAERAYCRVAARVAARGRHRGCQCAAHAVR